MGFRFPTQRRTIPGVGSYLLARRPAIPEGLPMPEVANAQDGVFTRSQARAAGWSDDRQRRLLRLGHWVAVAGPVLRHREVEPGPWQRGRAVHLTGGLVVSHATAGQLWGLRTDDGLHGIGHLGRSHTPVVAHRIGLPAAERVDVAGLALTSAQRTLTDLLCLQAQEASVTMVTDAIRRGILTAADLSECAAAATGRTGAGRARWVAESCRQEPHSVLEWRFHALIRALGPGWRFNVDVHDDRGPIGCVDALHRSSRTVIESDGRQFHGPDRFQADRTRDQRLTALGYVVLRFTWADVEQRPAEVLECIRRTLEARSRDRRSA